MAALGRISLLSALAGRYWSYLPNLAFQGLRLLTLGDYRFIRSGWAFAPLSINLELTARCNLKCRMCWLWGESGVGGAFVADELDTTIVKRTIDELSRMRPFIYLQGGEILIRKDVVEIMQHLAARRLVFGFTTNATLITEGLAREIVRRASAVSVSLDGPEARHDEIRGKGNFQRALQGIRLLLAARGASPLPAVKINTLFPGLSTDELAAMMRLGAELGVDVLKLGNLQFITRDRAESHKQVMNELFAIECRSVDGYVSDPRLDIADLWQKLLALRQKQHGPRLEAWSPRSQDTLKRWYCGTVQDSFRYCFFPWFSAMIRADGSVVPCGEYRHPEYSAGNVRDEPFAKIWNGPKMRRFRQVLRKTKFFPGCDRCCGLDSYAR
jgi:radical SAM protein with 4Fe4S-binding SPASM domain